LPLWHNDAWKQITNQQIGLLTMGDINGDGLADLVFTNENRLIVCYAHDLSNETVLVTPDILSIAIGDRNHDGRDDIWISASIGVYCWDAVSHQWTRIIDSSAKKISCGDFDGDNIDDLVGCFSSGIFYQQSSNGSWIKIQVADSDLSSLNDLLVADFNNDQLADFICSSASGVWLRDTAIGNWTQLHDKPDTCMTAGDIDGDGLKDLIIASQDVEGLWVRYSADGRFEKINPLSPTCLATGRFNASVIPAQFSFEKIQKLLIWVVV